MRPPDDEKRRPVNDESGAPADPFGGGSGTSIPEPADSVADLQLLLLCSVEAIAGRVRDGWLPVDVGLAAIDDLCRIGGILALQDLYGEVAT